MCKFLIDRTRLTWTAAAGAMEAFEIIEPTLDPATKKLLQNTILPGLENLLDLLRDQFVDLAAYLQRKDISKLAKIAAALVAAKTILPPVLSAASSAFGNEPTGKPTVTSSVSSSSSSSSQNPTKTPWIISTKQGTAQSDFQDLIDSLGNPSDGVEIGYPNMPYQIYAASLNDSMAQRAASSKIVGTMELDTAAVNDSETIIPFNPSINKRDNQWFPGLVPTPADLEKRVGSTVQPPPTFSTSPAGDLGLVQQLKSPEQLKLISDPTGGQGQIDYTFEANPGASTYVYVIDTGVNKDHMVSIGTSVSVDNSLQRIGFPEKTSPNHTNYRRPRRYIWPWHSNVRSRWRRLGRLRQRHSSCFREIKQ